MDEEILAALDFTIGDEILPIDERARLAFLDLKASEIDLLNDTVILEYAAMATDLPVTDRLDVNPYRVVRTSTRGVLEFGGLRFTDIALAEGASVYVPMYLSDGQGPRSLDEDTFSHDHALLVAGLVAGRAVEQDDQ